VHSKHLFAKTNINTESAAFIWSSHRRRQTGFQSRHAIIFRTNDPGANTWRRIQTKHVQLLCNARVPRHIIIRAFFSQVGGNKSTLRQGARKSGQHGHDGVRELPEKDCAQRYSTQQGARAHEHGQQFTTVAAGSAPVQQREEGQGRRKKIFEFFSSSPNVRRVLCRCQLSRRGILLHMLPSDRRTDDLPVVPSAPPRRQFLP